MKCMKREVRVERYAALFTRLENKMDDRLHTCANWLQLKTDQLSLQWKYFLFMVFCIGVSCLCAMMIVNALK